MNILLMTEFNTTVLTERVFKNPLDENLNYSVDVRFHTIAFVISEAHFFLKHLLESIVTLFLPRLTAQEAI